MIIKICDVKNTKKKRHRRFVLMFLLTALGSLIYTAAKIKKKTT